MTDAEKSPITRYTTSFFNGEMTGHLPNERGSWCKYEDVEPLLAAKDQRIAELEAEVKFLKAPTVGVADQCPYKIELCSCGGPIKVDGSCEECGSLW